MRKTGARSIGRIVRVLGAGVAGASIAWMVGCAKPLLDPKEPRSQYSRYDLVRGQFAPQYVEDEFGRRKPNLRGRLLLPE